MTAAKAAAKTVTTDKADDVEGRRPVARSKRQFHSAATIALCAGLLGLGACDDTPASLPSPMLDKPVPAESGVTAGSAGDPTVPSADSVLAPAAAPKVDPAQGRSNSSMTAAQESTAMPMPGQNNDHSAPLGPAKRASAP